MKRYIIGAAAVGLLVAGCGSGGETEPSSSSAAAASRTTTEKPAPLNPDRNDIARATVMLDTDGAFLTEDELVDYATEFCGGNRDEAAGAAYWQSEGWTRTQAATIVAAAGLLCPDKV